MDPQVSASFIPKKPLVADPKRRRGGGSLFSLIALLIFITSVVAAGVTFAYTQYLKSAIVSKSDSLKRAQAAYDPGVIEELIRLDQRLSAGQTILGSHLAPSAIFNMLSIKTLEQVQFDQFSYTVNEEGKAELILSGKAANFSTIALQSDEFSASKMLKDVVFGDLTISPTTGRVSFTVTASIDPGSILFRNNLGTGAPSTPLNTTPSEPVDVPPATTTTP